MTTMHALQAGTQSTTKALSRAEVRNKEWLAFQADLQERLEMQDYEVRDANPDNELAEAMIQAVYDKAL